MASATHLGGIVVRYVVRNSSNAGVSSGVNLFVAPSQNMEQGANVDFAQVSAGNMLLLSA